MAKRKKVSTSRLLVSAEQLITRSVVAKRGDWSWLEWANWAEPEAKDAYLFHSLKVEVGELDDVEGLVAEDLPRVTFQHVVESLWKLKLLSVLGRHY